MGSLNLYVGRLVVAAGMAVAVAGCAAAAGAPGGSSGSATGNAVLGDKLVAGRSGIGNYLAGTVAMRRNDLSAASRYFESALAGDPDNVDLMRSVLLVELPEGNIKRGAEIARQMQKYGATSTLGALVLSEQSAKSGDWTASQAQIAAVPSGSPLGRLLVPMVSAWALQGQGKTDAAITAMHGLDQVNGADIIRDYNIALINDLAGRNDAARILYTKLMTGDDGQVLRMVEAAANFFRRTGDAARATALVARFHKSHPQISIQLDNTDTRLVPTAQDGMAETIFLVMNALQQQRNQDIDQILDLGRLTLDLRPDFALAQATMGDILQELGRLEEADSVYAQVSPASPFGFAAQLSIAQNLSAMGKGDEALRTLQSMAVAHPERADVQIQIGEIYRGQRKWNDAIAAFTKAADANPNPGPNDWRLYFARGMAYERANQWPAAEADMMKALSLSPNQPEALNYLGYSWLVRGENLAEARRMIEQAVARDPTAGYIVDSLGWLLYRTGMYDQAVATLRRAIALEPADADINEHLGDALWAAGMQDEARFQWRYALVFETDGGHKADIQKKLDGGFSPPAPLRPTGSASAK